MKNYLYVLLLVVFSSFNACKQAPDQVSHPVEKFLYDYTVEKSIEVNEAAVSTAHPIASEVGKLILQDGGNAVDAAIAIQYALAVVYPVAGNIGGGGFMVLHTANGSSYSLDYREKAPSAAHKDMYLDSVGEVIPDKSLFGHLAAGVPGSVAGFFKAHEAHGKLPMEKLIQPAIVIAEKGFSITESEARALNRYQETFSKANANPTAFHNEKGWKEGDTLVQTDLAHTLQRIADHGKAGFYEGETAELIVKEMERGGGIISAEDLKNYEAVERDPIQFEYKNHHFITMGLPSSGGPMLEQMLKMLEPYDLGEMGYNSPEAINHVVEVERRAYADRAEYLGDPDFVEVPLDQLLDEEYIHNRMKDFVPGEAGKSENVKPGLEESEQTTHLSVIDKEGNAVSVTTTLNTNYGSKVVVDGAGFFLNNEMDDFSAKPGVPNIYGLLGNEANAIEPDKRMLSAMTPTIVLKDDQPYIVVGTPGGSTIITSVLQSVLNIIEFDLSAKEAVHNPKYHHQWQPDVIFIEDDFPEDLRPKLEEMGYELQERGQIGRTEMILIKDGKIHAVADKRGDDHAAGY